MDFERLLAKKIKTKLNAAKRADKKYGREFNLNERDVISLLFKQKACCVYCQRKMKLTKWDSYDPRQFTIERISNTSGHIKKNCKVACLYCNSLRSNTYSHKSFKTDSLCLFKSYHGSFKPKLF